MGATTAVQFSQVLQLIFPFASERLHVFLVLRDYISMLTLVGYDLQFSLLTHNLTGFLLLSLHA
jgi:hypothetical protein